MCGSLRPLAPSNNYVTIRTQQITTQQRPELPARTPVTKKSKCTTKTGLPTRPYSKAQELAVRIARIFKNIGKFTAPNTPFHMDG